MQIRSIAAAALLALSTAAVHATDIDFDSGSNGAAVGSFYAGLTFSGASFTSNFGLSGSSGPLGIASTTNNYMFTAAQAITISFATAISSFGIDVIDLGSNGFTVEAYDAANTLLGSSTEFGPDVGVGHFDKVSVAYDGISSVRMFQALSTFGDGVLLDNLSYEASAVVAVPEPSTYALMALGLAGLGIAARRRRQD
jgi:PEP-CTERM motif